MHDDRSFWRTIECEAPGVLRTLAGLAARESFTPEERAQLRQGVLALEASLRSLDPAALGDALRDESLLADWLLATAGVPMRDALRLLALSLGQAGAVGQPYRDERPPWPRRAQSLAASRRAFVGALERLCQTHPEAARVVLYQWQSVCRWITVHRLFSPARTDRVREALAAVRAGETPL